MSCDQASTIPPSRLTLPNVGRMPLTPLRLDGTTIEPPVSEPIEKPTRPAAVAAPGPAEDPSASTLGSQGQRVVPPNQRAVTAIAPVESLATRMAPASVNRV